MGRPRRMQKPDEMYVVFNRCISGLSFFRPGPEVNEIIERSLVWAADKQSILVYAYIFEPNAYEIIIGAPRLNRQHFLRDFQSVLATQLKALHGRTERGFFAGRYDCEPFADLEPVLDEIARVVCRPCETGLVAHPGDWPGVSSWSQHSTAETIVARREDRQLYWRLRQKHPDLAPEQASKLATSTHTMQLALPFDWDVGDAQRVVTKAIEDRAATQARRWNDAFVGARAVQSWDPNQRPRRTCPPRHRRRCIASSQQSRARHAAERWNANLWYEWGRRRLRLGLPSPQFPYGMIPLHQVDAVGACESPESQPSQVGASRQTPEPPDTTDQHDAA